MLVVEAINSGGNPATLMNTLTVSLLSTSTGEYQFLASPTGPKITALSLSSGSNPATLYYQDDKAANVTLTASVPSLPPGTLPVSVLASSFAKLQILMPGEAADPGRPTADPSGHTGNPGGVQAGYPFVVTVNEVDPFFNVVSSPTGPVTLTSTDLRGVMGSPTNLAGSGSVTVILYTPPSQTISASGLGTSVAGDPVTVLPGSLSSLNMTHGTPQLSTVEPGQSFNVLTFNFTIAGGSDPASILSMVLHSEDSSGNPVSLNTAFQTFTVATSSGIVPVTVSGPNSDLVTLGQSTGVSLGLIPGTNLAVTIGVQIANSPSAKNVRLSLDNVASVSAQDSVSQSTAQVTALGDSTGFPMQSQLMVFLPPDVASTYGNYPNPFHPGQGSTTIEFNLQSAATVSLVLYDVMGNQVETLINNQNLPAGLQRAFWDGRNGTGNVVLNGIYYAQLTVGGQKYMIKIAVVK